MSKPAADREHDRAKDADPAGPGHADDADHEAMGPSWQAAKLRAVDDELDMRELYDLDPKADAERRRDQRFDNDEVLEEIAAGTRVIKSGDTGRAVTKLQVALLDLGYLKGKGVDGDFRGETEKALKKYQGAAGVGPTGQFDAATLASLRARFGGRKPYVDLAKHRAGGVHKLEDYEKEEALEAMLPRKPGEKFLEEVAGEHYGPKVEARLAEKIAKYHAEAASNAAKRDKPEENFHDWDTLEGPCKAGKTQTDKVYGSYKTMPAFSHKKRTLNDFFEDQKAVNKGLNDEDKKAKAANLVRYLINSKCADINKVHHADVDGSAEKAILDPIVDALTDTEAKVQILLELFMDWPGAARGGKMFLQRYKADTDDKNREDLWSLFHTAIHEYIHTLKHEKYTEWANELGGARYHTLIEGFCDFFTLNVRSQLALDATLQEKVEGTFFDKG
ncbi:MAG TPA: peptidoglycan-binding domain-containing protein, partial [Kofleriaceae bacterium]|nr:peptidoglycan-binding domain-containing protein [Kofleriaceae bacterium]